MIDATDFKNNLAYLWTLECLDLKTKQIHAKNVTKMNSFNDKE